MTASNAKKDSAVVVLSDGIEFTGTDGKRVRVEQGHKTSLLPASSLVWMLKQGIVAYPDDEPQEEV